MLEYKLIVSGNAKDLSDEVTAALNKGWQLHGYAFPCAYERRSYAQALTRFNDPVKPDERLGTS